MPLRCLQCENSREQTHWLTDRLTDRQNEYCNPRCACAPRVNKPNPFWLWYIYIRDFNEISLQEISRFQRRFPDFAEDFRTSTEFSRFHERFQDFPGDLQISRNISGFPRRFQARCTRYPQLADPSRNSGTAVGLRLLCQNFFPLFYSALLFMRHLSFMPTIPSKNQSYFISLA